MKFADWTLEIQHDAYTQLRYPVFMNCLNVTLLSCLILTDLSCSLPYFKTAKKIKTPSKTIVEGPKLIGIIASTPADQRFVLIQSYGKWSIEVGRILVTRGSDQRSANLRVTGESLGEFAAADVQSGLIQVGDAVYTQDFIKLPTDDAALSESSITSEPLPGKLKNN
jgi:hypothetical protein